jgi:hypothetical protein
LDNIFKCPSCKKTFISEEEYTHKCDFDVVEIPVTDYYERDSKIVAWGINGKVYPLVKGESPRVGRSIKSPEDGTEPLRTLQGINNLGLLIRVCPQKLGPT